MKNVKGLFILAAIGSCLICLNSCKGKSGKESKQASEKVSPSANVKATLFDMPLPEIKKLINGRWELLSGKNPSQLCEYENTFIVFNDDKYIWSEDGNDEPGDLNWRKADTGLGYESYLMDVFYATNPSYPLAINGDTLFIQDCSETKYKYTLVRR